MISAQEAKNGSDKSIKLDYTFKLNADEAKNAHNALNDGNLMGDEQANGTSGSKRYLDFTFSFSVSGQYYNAEDERWTKDTNFLYSNNTSTYSYFDRSSEYWEATDFNKWDQTSPRYDFIKFSFNGKDAQFSINVTIADLLKYIQQENPDYSQIKILYISIYVGSGYASSNTSFDGGMLDSEYIAVYDIHSREAGIPDRAWRLNLDKQLEMMDGAPHVDDEEYTLTDSDYLAPTSIKYTYHAMFQNRGPYYYQDQNGEYQDMIIGFAPDDFQGNLYIEINPHNGKTYGFWYGEIVKTDNNKLKLREFVNAQNRALIMSMIGLKASGEGGTAMIMIGCEVEFTFADGKKLVVPVNFGHEMTHLVAPCIHACPNCGECTAKEMLECNSNGYYGGADGIRVSECKCGNSNPITITPVFNGTTDVDGTTYDVDINELSTSNNTEGTYIEALQNITPNLDIQAIYQVDVTSQNGNNKPFNGQSSNQVATVTFRVNNTIGQGLQNGNLGVVHINTEKGEGEEFEKETSENQGQHGTYQVLFDETDGYSVTITSNSYSPILIVNKSHTHNYSTEWQKDDTHHWHKCECGEIEYKYTHIYDNDQDTTCNDCGYIRQVSNPTNPNEEEECILIINVTATMSEPVAGNDGSSLVFTVPNGAKYTVDFEYVYHCVDPFIYVDAENPFVGGNKYAFRVKFNADGGYYFDENTIFTVNGIEAYAVGSNGLVEFEYTVNHLVNPTKNDGLSGGAIAGIVIGSTVVLSLGGFAIFWFVVRKKSFAELLTAIKSIFKKK